MADFKLPLSQNVDGQSISTHKSVNPSALTLQVNSNTIEYDGSEELTVDFSTIQVEIVRFVGWRIMSIYLGTNKVAMSMDTVIPYKPGYLRTDAELVKTITYEKLAVTDEGYTIPEYTTTSTTYIASESLTDTVSLDLSTYNYFITEVFFSYPTYNITTTAKGRVEYYFGV